MNSLRRAVVVGLAALAACRTPTHDAHAADSAPPAPSAREIAGVQPEFLPAFEELQRAVASGDDLIARRILRGIEARGPTGAALSLAQAFERVLAGREAVSELHLSLVVRSQADEHAPAPPALPTQPTPNGAPDKDTASGGEHPSTNVHPSESAPSSGSNRADASTNTPTNSATGISTGADAQGADDPTPPSRLEARILFVVENTAAVPIELRPGPASLNVTKTSVGRLKMVRVGEPMVGGEEQSTETHPYAALRDLRLEPGRSIEIELARFFVDVPDGDLAVRLAFELDLRSGSIVRDGRELPAMNVPVTGCEATRWGKLRYPEWKPTPEGLEQYVLRAAPITADCALEIAVRIPPSDHARALDGLAAREAEISEPHLVQIMPALRWLTEDTTLGGDESLWRVYLRRRAGAKSKTRPKLELPPQTE